MFKLIKLITKLTSVFVATLKYLSCSFSKLKQKILHSPNKNMILMLLITTTFFGLIFGYKAFGNFMMHRYFNSMGMPVQVVTSTTAKIYYWDTVLESVGNLKAVNNVEVTTEAAGVVAAIKFVPGQQVNKGQILLKLNTKADQAKLAAVIAQLKLAEQNLFRAKKLIKVGSIAASELELKQSQAEQAKAQVVLQQELLAQKNIVAPFDGILGIRKVNIGEYLAPGNAIVSLQSLDPIYVNFALPEQEIAKIKLGLAVAVKVAAFPNQQFLGKITAIEPGVDLDTRNFNIQATFENQALQLRPGMFAEIIVKLAKHTKVLAIPRTAISFNPYGNSVYILQPIKADPKATKNSKLPLEAQQYLVKRRFVKIANDHQELVAIADGLVKDELVVTSGLLKLRNDAIVTLNNAAAVKFE